jgi:hypothetical protein
MHVRNVPGRTKTDVLDCQWIQKLHSFGVLNRFFAELDAHDSMVPVRSGSRETTTPVVHLLGHVHVADTQWYLEGSPELMREAMQRLQQRWEDRP